MYLAWYEAAHPRRHSGVGDPLIQRLYAALSARHVSLM